jgi:hypothetical protein
MPALQLFSRYILSTGACATLFEIHALNRSLIQSWLHKETSTADCSVDAEDSTDESLRHIRCEHLILSM